MGGYLKQNLKINNPTRTKTNIISLKKNKFYNSYFLETGGYI